MKGFVNVHVDAEQAEGKALAQRYGALGFPTLVMVDASGEELDRIVGYLPPDKFVPEVERVLRGEGTIPALRRAVEEAPDDLGASIALGRKLAPSRPQEAYALLEGVAARAREKDPALEARALVAFGLAGMRSTDEAVARRALAALERVVVDLPDTEAAQGALRPLVMNKARNDPGAALALLTKLRDRAPEHRLAADEELMEAGILLRLAGAALERSAASAQDDPAKLGMIALTAYRQRLAVRPAIAWARKALEGGKREAPLLDALANLVQMTGGDIDEAVALEKEAVGKATAPVLKAEYESTLAKFERIRASKDAGPRGVVPGSTPAVPVERAPEKPAAGAPATPKPEPAPKTDP
jgi:hypothetical protein